MSPTPPEPASTGSPFSRVLDALESVLRERTHLEVARVEPTLVAKLAVSGGYDIALCVEASEMLVYFGTALHEHFTDPAEALACFTKGLTSDCRVLEVYTGSRILLARRDDRNEFGEWAFAGMTGFFRFPWRVSNGGWRINSALSPKQAQALLAETFEVLGLPVPASD